MDAYIDSKGLLDGRSAPDYAWVDAETWYEQNCDAARENRQTAVNVSMGTTALALFLIGRKNLLRQRKPPTAAPSMAPTPAANVNTFSFPQT